MKFVKIDPPGTWCFNQAFTEMLTTLDGKRFLEIGTGGGDIAKLLLDKGYEGVGVDFSIEAIGVATEKLKNYIDQGQFKLINADIMEDPDVGNDFDFVFSLLVMEHVHDDCLFLEKLKKYVRAGGHVLVSVPGRMDCWSLEDETVGHLRRYERSDLEKLAIKANLIKPEVWSISVPVSNILFGLSKIAVALSTEKNKIEQSQKEQTQSSGIREIPFKTVFPAPFKLILNNITMSPLYFIQRFFYKTNRGLTMLLKAQRKNDE